jgi:hypothetical protein
MVKGAKGCAFGLLIGTLLRTMTVAVEFLSRIVAKLLVLFGLWIPSIYALFGVFLYLLFDFDPFDFSLYSSLYLSGAVACVVCCVIISIRNIIVRPARSVVDGYKHPLWEKHRDEKIKNEKKDYENYLLEKKGEELSPPEVDDFATQKYHKKNIDYLPPSNDFDYRVEEKQPIKLKYDDELSLFQQNMPPKDNRNSYPTIEKIKVERPSVYFSKLEPELLIHEYSDRFELFRIKNNRSILDRVEYK